MKRVNYRGGLISFEIPNSWIEEYEENGGGTFYEDSPESGTLRVNVLTIKEKSSGESVNDLIKNSINSSTDIEMTNEYPSFKEDSIIESVCRTQENDIPITQYRFDCVHKTNQSDYLIAMFTWTVKTEFEKLDNYIKDFKMVQNAIISLGFGR
ncbi:hypothetical protein [Maribacter sp. 2308TA10-17]|uniref:hypothetical protein n=1 Tax=Maribacter sp. 2308TA10-17 TaxID=3386276 RepID=UPI0039BC77FF